MERTYCIDRGHLLTAIVDECRNSAGFLVTEGPELTRMSIDMGKGADIEYVLDNDLFGEIKNEILNIKAAKTAEGKKQNG